MSENANWWPKWLVSPGGPGAPQAPTESIALEDTYADSGSYQSHAIDLELDAAAGTSEAGDTAFLASGMFNLLGDTLTKTKNYLAGLIGAYSVTGAKAGELQAGAVIGLVMDGVTDVDGAVVGVIDGDDPSSETRAHAIFAARMNNNNAASGADYGVDLHDAGRSSGILSGGGDALSFAKADLRLSGELCVLSGGGAPVDYTDGTPPATGQGYAAIGSIYIDRTAGALYLNTGTKAHPAWSLLAFAV